MTDRPVEPPLSDELPEMIQRASEHDDLHVFRICDAIIAHRRRVHERQQLANANARQHPGAA